MATVKSLVVDKLSCRYSDRWIFRDISFSIDIGETIAIIGSSGCGKTTLAYCLMGIIPNKIPGYIDGDVIINGENIRDLNFHEILRHINMVLQDYNLQIFGLTPEEDIIFSLENSGVSGEEIYPRLNKIIDRFGLGKYRNIPVSHLSGGFRQRLSIASTISMEPEFLILDDPTANLDWTGVKSLIRTIEELKKDGKGIIITTSRIKGLMSIVDKVVYMNNNIRRSRLASKRTHYRTKSDSNKSKTAFEVINVDSVWFKYDRDYVLKNINLTVYNGEILLLMGPNGSGKTTLAKHFNGLLKPSRGSVRILGMDTRKHSTAELAKYVGFVFQDPGRHITKETVLEETIFGCKNLNLPYCKADESLKRLGLYDYQDYPPYKLSIGEKTRLSIASALAVEPSILILDEPTTGQDEYTLEILKRIILEMKSEGKTILIITHDTDYALSIGTRLVILLNGEIMFDGKPEDILTDPTKTEKYGIEPVSRSMVSSLEKAVRNVN